MRPGWIYPGLILYRKENTGVRSIHKHFCTLFKHCRCNVIIKFVVQYVFRLTFGRFLGRME